MTTIMRFYGARNLYVHKIRNTSKIICICVFVAPGCHIHVGTRKRFGRLTAGLTYIVLVLVQALGCAQDVNAHEVNTFRFIKILPTLHVKENLFPQLYVLHKNRGRRKHEFEEKNGLKVVKIQSSLFFNNIFFSSYYIIHNLLGTLHRCFSVLSIMDLHFDV